MLVELRPMVSRLYNHLQPSRGRRNRQAGTTSIYAALQSLPLIALLIVAGDAAANTPIENLRQVQLLIDDAEKALAEGAIKYQRTRDTVLEIERLLYTAIVEQEKYRTLLDAKIVRLESLRTQHDQLNQSFAATQGAIRQTIMARYVLWRQPKLKILFNNTQITELQRNLRYYDYVATATNATLQQQATQRRDLHDVAAALKLEASKLKRLRDEAEDHTNTLTEALARRSDIAAALEQLRHKNEHALQQLREDENQLTTLVDEIIAGVLASEISSTPFGNLKGKLPWPTAGRIAMTPGSSMHKGGANWRGVIIESDPGSDVIAVAPGRVAFADWFRNLGLLVIIDHGEGYMSLYGHNRELYKHSGDWIEVGEIIAAVGHTGGRSITGLYFEIRHDGIAQDPRLWCKG